MCIPTRTDAFPNKLSLNMFKYAYINNRYKFTGENILEFRYDDLGTTATYQRQNYDWIKRRECLLLFTSNYFILMCPI
jgi:hypothetical protein